VNSLFPVHSRTTLISRLLLTAGISVPAAISMAASMPPVPAAVPHVGVVVAATPTPEPVPPYPTGLPAEQAAFLVNEALNTALKYPAARPIAVKTAASLLPRLPISDTEDPNRDKLTRHWLQLANSKAVTRPQRLDAFEAFFDNAVNTDPNWASDRAGDITDDAGRAAAYMRLSQALEPKDWTLGEKNARLAQAAAQAEADPTLKATELVFVAYRLVVLGAADQDVALSDARTAIHAIPVSSTNHDRDFLLSELVGAAAKYDLPTARDIDAEIQDPDLKKLADARINIAEISQSTLTGRANERVAALATAAAPYDSSARPILLLLPPQPEVLQAIAETLPPIFPGERPNISVTELDHVWEYTQTAPDGAYKDQLQSRCARLMILHDLWRGRDWGKQLSWKGGRIQVGAFLKAELDARQSKLRAGALEEVAKENASRAYVEAYGLPPVERTEALLLLAGQILG